MSASRTDVTRAWDRGRGDRPDWALLAGLEDRFTHAVVAYLDDEGYPLSVATSFRSAPDRGVVELDQVAGEQVAPPEGAQVNVVFSHIRPQPGYGYDERRYVSLWGTLRRATIQGDAIVDDTDLHSGWERKVLPMWRKKEPAIDFFLGKRVALPLFFERGIIEIRPRRVFLWEDGDTSQPPQVWQLEGADR